MAEPTQKNPAIESFLTGAFGFDRRESIKNETCIPAPIGCGKMFDQKDMTEIEQKEYRISGLCPQCQREIFGSDPEE